MVRRSLAVLTLAACLPACASLPGGQGANDADASAGAAREITHREPIFAAADALEKDWRKVRVWEEMEFSLVPAGDGVAIRAIAEGGSAALAREVEIDPSACPEVEWSWRVESLPEAAELSSREAEDMAASIFFAFGDPGVLTNPREVPTLRYVWATEDDAAESVHESPYFPGIIRSLVVRSGATDVGSWVTERRDLLADFARVFGGQPEEPVRVIALYTDSDHGETRVEALYRSATSLCLEAPDAPSIFG